jgi:hypothetical protein
LHRIGAGAGTFGHRVAVIVNDVDVVALAAAQGVGADQTVQKVGAVIAGQLVGESVASRVDGGYASQNRVLDHPAGEGREVDRDRRSDRILAGRFNDHVAGAVDHIGVVAIAAVQLVVAAAAVERVVPLTAYQNVRRSVARERVVGIVTRHVSG